MFGVKTVPTEGPEIRICGKLTGLRPYREVKSRKMEPISSPKRIHSVIFCLKMPQNGDDKYFSEGGNFTVATLWP